MFSRDVASLAGLRIKNSALRISSLFDYVSDSSEAF